MAKHVFFDLDDTLTPSRSPMRSEHEPLFEELCRRKDIVIVTGARDEQIHTQIPPRFNGNYYTLSQQGNYCTAKDGSVLWNDVLTEDQTAAVMKFVKIVHDEAALPVKDENDLVENRGCQISYSMLGQHEDLAKKRAFDPDASLRRAILAKHPLDVRELETHGIEVKIGGTTNFDFYHAGHHKGFNVVRLIQLQNWRREDSIYIGDALAPGRNDETVLGVIPTHAITDPNDTFSFIKDTLLPSV